MAILKPELRSFDHFPHFPMFSFVFRMGRSFHANVQLKFIGLHIRTIARFCVVSLLLSSSSFASCRWLWRNVAHLPWLNPVSLSGSHLLNPTRGSQSHKHCAWQTVWDNIKIPVHEWCLFSDFPSNFHSQWRFQPEHDDAVFVWLYGCSLCRWTGQTEVTLTGRRTRNSCV